MNIDELKPVPGKFLELLNLERFAELSDFIHANAKPKQRYNTNAESSWQYQVPFRSKTLPESLLQSGDDFLKFTFAEYNVTLNTSKINTALGYPVIHGFVCAGNPWNNSLSTLTNSEVEAYAQDRSAQATKQALNVVDENWNTFYKEAMGRTFGLKLYLWVNRPHGSFLATPCEIVIVYIAIRMSSDYQKVECIAINTQSNKYWEGTHCPIARSYKSWIKFSIAYKWNEGCFGLNFSNDSEMSHEQLINESLIHQRVTLGICKALAM